MKTTKMSLANIQGKLSRAEMKKIMAGSGDDAGDDTSPCAGKNVGDPCQFTKGSCQGYWGACKDTSSGRVCAGGC